MTFKTRVLDVETTTKAKGNPFHKENKLVVVGLDYHTRIFNHESYPPILLNEFDSLLLLLEDTDVLVGHNIKFDLHWIRRAYPTFKPKHVWDTQLAEFIITNQKSSMVSLDDLAKKYLGDRKSSDVKEYWNAGIDTDKIPISPLMLYLAQDIRLTELIYIKQKEILLKNTKKFELFKLHCKDLLVLEDMEFNGLIFNHKASLELKQQTLEEIKLIDAKLESLFPNDPINYNSSDHLSSLLYGGYVKYTVRVPFTKTLKDGRIKEGTRTEVKSSLYPRLVEPKKGTEGSVTKKYNNQELEWENIKRLKEGKALLQRSYSVDQNILRSLHPKNKTAKLLIKYILERNELNKLVTTYYEGLPRIIKENGWNDNEIHGQFNQTIARTGRLSSSNPNEQNFSGKIKHLFTSRYE